MSLYEILAVFALAGALGYAWCLYRSDMRSKARGSEGTPTAAAAGGLIFARDRKARDENVTGSDAQTSSRQTRGA